jgi:5-methylcytosine-specific restriction endonuclease McrA
MPYNTATAIVLNGVFEDVLLEILLAQANAPGKPHFLQPYASDKITLLAKEPPSEALPRTLYLSLTTSLDQISYHAEIVGWRDKRKIESAELKALNQEVEQFQPNEKEVYQTVSGGPCVNLISIIRLAKYPAPIPTSCFIKVSNNHGLRKRTRAGGWSYVHEQDIWLGESPISVLDDAEKDLGRRVQEAQNSSSSQRQARLAAAPHKPKEIQVLSRAFLRNADVIVEVLDRANGICEQCGSKAPFLRAKNGLPYLEVHHKVALALGGDDTVANATALCPNCHRQNHFGKTGSPQN